MADQALRDAIAQTRMAQSPQAMMGNPLEAPQPMMQPSMPGLDFLQRLVMARMGRI
jgi:hypothetical protein